MKNLLRYETARRRPWLAPTLCAAILAIGCATRAQAADQRFKVVRPTPGGISPAADITSVQVTNGQMKVEWNGFGGPYQLQVRPDAATGRWLGTGNPTNAHSHVIPATNPSGFLRVRAPDPGYTGASTCAECHPDMHQGWSQTIHAGAFNTLKAIGQEANPECIKCHSVAAGLSTGFKSEALTPSFAGVQCENCHGPALDHANDPLNVRPVITYDAQLCGGCHSDFHHPTYNEWSTSLHSRVDPHVQAYFLDPNPTNSVARMNSCGACHSGAVRLAMLRSVKSGLPVELPSGHEAAETSQTCTVCHDPHKPNLDNTHSLRNPRFSTNFFSYNTATNTNFKAQYNPNVQVCGQCHNMRGAAPTDTSRPPHHSVQYNLLIGDAGSGGVGYVPGAPIQAGHTKIQDQCTHCHTHQHTPAVPTEEEPVFTGHSFEPNAEACLDCHKTPGSAEALVTTTQAQIKAQIQEVKGLLDQWGQTKAPAVLRDKYGKLAWEYNAPGQLSNPTGATSIVGPTTKEQADVNLDIKKARMYLYIVEHDGSYGVHNAKYARYLLANAKTNVVNLLNAP